MQVKRFNAKQLDRLSEFSSNLGLVFVAGAIAPFFSGGKTNLQLILIQIGLSLWALIISLYLVRRR